MTRVRILIVGGGIAGLATAAGLARRGIECEIVERAEQWKPVGAGIVLGVNAMSVLAGLGLDEAALARGTVLGGGAITDDGGRKLATTDFAELRPAFGPTVALHRAELHDLLRAGAPDVPVTLGASVEQLHPAGDSVEVRFTTGREDRFDLVVGADGLRSRVRELVFGERKLAYSGYTCWRLVVEAPGPCVEMREMWGSGRRFGIVPIGGGRLYCFATLNAPQGAPDPVLGRLDRFRRRYAGFGGAVPAILDALTRDEELIHNDLEELPNRTWQRGRVVLIGDAAHAMTPNMGQGAAMGLEDAAVLVELLGGSAGMGAVPAALEARREPRVRWVQEQSRRIGRIGQLEHPAARALRNAVVRAIPDRANTAALRRLASARI
jgi:2-heptyl-3-hydroxy-4(1H)-quinolone synthase